MVHCNTLMHISDWAHSEMDSVFRCYSPELMQARWAKAAHAMDEQGCAAFRGWLQNTHMNENWRLWCYCASGVEGNVANTNMIESFHAVIKACEWIDLNRESTAHFHYVSIDQLCRCVC